MLSQPRLVVNMQMVAGVDQLMEFVSGALCQSPWKTPLPFQKCMMLGLRKWWLSLRSNWGVLLCFGSRCVPCNAHSHLGDGRGMRDPRSISLPNTLELGWLLQSVVILLEWVPQMIQDVDVQTLLASFVQQTGYRLTQQVLLSEDGRQSVTGGLHFWLPPFLLVVLCQTCQNWTCVECRGI